MRSRKAPSPDFIRRLESKLRQTEDVEERCAILQEALADRPAGLDDELAELFRGALPNAMYETIILGIDGNGTYRFVFTDPALDRRYGIRGAEMVHRNLRDIFPAEDAERRVEAVRELLRTGGRLREENTVRMPKGEFWHDTCLAAVPRNEGPADIVLAFIHDITERKHTERRLRESEERYRSVVEQASDSIVIHQAGRIVYANPATYRTLGAKDGTLEGRNPLEFVAEDMRDVAAARMREVLTISQSLEPLTYTFIRVDGSTLIAEVVGNRITYGDAPAALLTIRDVTERHRRQRLDEQIRRAQKLESLAALAGGVAHDFNNLLVGILGNASLALARIPVGTTGRDRVLGIKKAANRAADLTRQLLSYAGEGNLQVTAVSLNETVEEMVGLVGVSISKSVLVERNLDPALPAIIGEPTQLRQLIMNLLLNASEAIGDRPGKIDVSTSTFTPDEAWLTTAYASSETVSVPHAKLRVSDDGCGMSEATLSRLFDPFYSTKASGRGLGLATVMGVVRDHGAAMRVHSEEGRGSVFEVLLPLASQAPTARPPTDSNESTPWQGSGRILVVDDEDRVRDVARAALTHLGFDVEEASDGPSALETFRRSPEAFAAVMLDVTMPGMRGDEVLERLRAIRPNVRVLVISGYREQEVRNRMVDGDAALFMAKPFSLEDVESSLRRLLEA